MFEASIASAHGYITVAGVVLIVGLLLIRAAIRKPEKWQKALLPGTLFVVYCMKTPTGELLKAYRNRRKGPSDE